MGSDWLYEIKADGYRAQVHLRGGKATVYSRTGLDWSKQFRRIGDAAEKLGAREIVLDGEAVVYGSNGIPDFQAMRRATGVRSSAALRYHAFDVLYLDGRDLRQVPYIERKSLLDKLLQGAPEELIYVEYLEADDGQRVFEHACKMGLEGIVAKRRDSIYRSGRSDAWLKLKCKRSDTFPIVAFVEKLGAKPRRIASLYVGRRERDQVFYAGKVQTGYTHESAQEIRERLDPFIREKSPLSKPVEKPKATWVEPVVEAEIEYGALTDDGLLRAAVFKGLRDDLAKPEHPPKPPPYISRHRRQTERGVRHDNILQLLPDAVAPSKEQLGAYWRKSHNRALVYLARRPLKLVRHTHGITFYHRGPLPPIANAVHQLHIQKREGGEGVRVWVDDLEGLLGLVEMDPVELHPWAATIDDIEHPDRLVFDLDPGAGVEWEFVTETALSLRSILADEGYDSWPKLTGGKGLHLMVPIERGISHDEAAARSVSLWHTADVEQSDIRIFSVGPTMANTFGITQFETPQRNSAPRGNQKSFSPGSLLTRTRIRIRGLISALLIGMCAASPASRGASNPLPTMYSAGCFSLPDTASRKLCLNKQRHAQAKSAESAKTTPDPFPPLKPPPDRGLDTSFCRGDAKCIKDSSELQSAGDCVDLKSAQKLGHGSEALAEAIANECLSEYLRRFHPETSLAEVQKLEREAPNGILANIPGNHVGIAYAGKFGFLTLRAQQNFDCRNQHPGGHTTICNAPIDQTYIEEDWPYWRERGESRTEFDRWWAEELRRRDYRRRWLQQLAARPQVKSPSATAQESAATQSQAGVEQASQPWCGSSTPSELCSRPKSQPKRSESTPPQEKSAKVSDCQSDLRCWGKENMAFAWTYCKESIERLAKYDVQWKNRWLEPIFSRYQWLDKDKGTLTYIGDAAQFQNQFGAWAYVTYTCDIDPKARTVIGARVVGQGRLPP